MKTVLSIIESPTHPDFSALYRELGLENVRTHSLRKAVIALKKGAPDFVVAEFFYGYGNNYAGVNISNLDVFLYGLQKYAGHTKVIVLVDKAERRYVDKLEDIYPIDAVLTQPVEEADLRGLLEAAPPHPA